MGLRVPGLQELSKTTNPCRNERLPLDQNSNIETSRILKKNKIKPRKFRVTAIVTCTVHRPGDDPC